MLYRYGQGWERMVSLTEAVPVRGEADQPVTLLFTRHGPVIHQDLEAHRAYAVRTVWSEPGAAAYLGSLRYLDAETPEDFAAALAHWMVPPVNQVHAGKDGQIGWIAAAAVPRRPNWDGLTPVPGDGRFEWDGFWQGTDLPRRLNPAEGFIATANALNLPHGYPAADRRLGFEWYDRFRADRLDAVLADGHSLTLDDSQRLQTDRLSEPALRLTALLTATGLLPPLLSGWDCRITAESAAAALFEVWWSRHLKPAVLAARTPSAAVAALLAPGDSHAILETLESPEPFWPVASRNAALAGTLQAAMEDCATLMGPDPSGWAWGRLHRQHFAHGLGRLLPTLEGYRLDLEPLPVDGSGATGRPLRVSAGRFRDHHRRLVPHGARCRGLGTAAASSTRRGSRATRPRPIMRTLWTSGPQAASFPCSTAARPSTPPLRTAFASSPRRLQPTAKLYSRTAGMTDAASRSPMVRLKMRSRPGDAIWRRARDPSSAQAPTLGRPTNTKTDASTRT